MEAYTIRITFILHLIFLPFLNLPAFAADDRADIDDTYFARWSINNGKYLVDIGKYLEAIEAFQTAIETTDKPHLKAEAHLQMASVLSVFLDKIDEAAKEYELIFKEFPADPLAETALYRTGFLYFSQSRFKDAIPYLESYLKKYPKGRFSGTVQFLLKESRKNLKLPPPPPSTFELPPLFVRVKLLKDINSISITSQGLISVYGFGDNPIEQANEKINFSVKDNVLYADEKPLNTKEITAKAKNPIGFARSGKPLLYRGDMRILLKDNKIEVINYVNIEEYLYGVVPSESPSSWHIEALKAQAIAARTYVLYQMAHSKERDYDVMDDERSQVYGGVKAEKASSTNAVNATMGQVLAYEGRPIYAMFTASSGWHTADPKDIFNQQLPYLQGFSDEYSKGERHGQWIVKKDRIEIEKGLKAIGINISGITDIKPEVVDKSGRIIKVLISYEGGSKVLRTRTTLRRAADMMEILFGIEKDNDAYIFKGGGFGHGVGMSQWGAKDMAEKGKTAEEILSFYYRGAELKKMW
ncbi:MAG: hypothetical protein A2073_08095 [Deltaproteobacteria bacterium GWC2_42_11]|nr:MAG: hypothetical protein A2073_08095 [Deltaproteobacteria bacterium GWC2_42_11]